MAQPAARYVAEGADAERLGGVDGGADQNGCLDGEIGGEDGRVGKRQADAEAAQAFGGCWIEGDAHAIFLC